ncbi:Alpha/beta hydrolase family protein [Quillaja saponaria]|uniref:Alpha/beta hydrolase family protein n=1 Tax=Quillaja saponaria TaxID=32244 RepID=A0AAD7KP17_QUISA|nr:Alpha/beta hydrolase family protein [Quillaja saponaria]
MATIQSDILSAFHIASSTFRSYSPYLILSRASSRRVVPLWSWSSSTTVVPTTSLRLRAFSSDSCEAIIKVRDKPSICTADELHYVSVPNSDWRLALWRYRPPPEAPPRNHPLLLLSGVGTNAIGYDLSPGSSFARYMSGQGFDTWILEVRGAGLSVQGSNVKEIEQSAHAISEQMEAVSESATNGPLQTEQQSSSLPGGVSESKSSVVKEEKSDVLAVKGDVTGLATVWDESRLVSRLSETFMSLSERLSGFLSESQSKVMSAKLLDQISKLLGDSQLSERYNEIRGKLSSLLETRENTGIANQIRDLSQRLVNIIDEGQRSVSPPLFDLQERFSSTLEDFQKQLELIVKYDWDFDHYLEEDVPAVMEYIRAESKPKDGKLLAIGHSMGGILLYAMLSRFGFEGKDPKLAAVVTLASSLDYTSSKSTLKLLLPLADPAQALNVPVVPLGTLLSAAYPLSSSPPYVLSWLNSLISAEDMMDTELLRKLVLNNFCTIPVKLLLQLTTAFREGGLCDRSGTFFYKDHLNKSNVPVLALAGDRDLICPPEAVEETVKLIPEHLVSYKLFGEPTGPHYAHYDLVGGRKAVEQVYPCIIEFLSCNDK